MGYRHWFADLSVTKVMEFDWWDKRDIVGAAITATPSQHCRAQLE